MQALQTKKIYQGHLVTPRSLVVVFDYGPPVTIPRGNVQFDMIRSLLEQERYLEVPDAVDKARYVHKTTKGKFTIQDGSVIIDGQTLPDSLSDKLLELVESGESTQRLENFWNNLAQNPTDSARQDLYGFLAENNVPITRDGCFIAYKTVKHNFWDKYTGDTFNCKPGNIVEMVREKVDHNRQNTCSNGLHVAAFEYAHNFGNNDDRLMECKVNPRDVVAVPPDYSQRKMRVCRAEILRETTTKFVEAAYNDDTSDGRLINKLSGMTLTTDKEGRLRIPGRYIRHLGVGVWHQVEVVHDAPQDRYLYIQALSTDESFNDWCVLTVDKDNSIRVSKAILESAGLDHTSKVTLDVSEDYLTLR